jgi:hypothetical protein
MKGLLPQKAASTDHNPVQSSPTIETTSSKETFSESTCYETRSCFETTDLLCNNSDGSSQSVVWEKQSFPQHYFVSESLWFFKPVPWVTSDLLPIERKSIAIDFSFELFMTTIPMNQRD